MKPLTLRMVVVQAEDGGKRLAFPEGRGGALGPDERAYRACIDRLGVGEELEMRLRAQPKRQGTQSMRYYRGVVVPDIAAACGYTDPEDWAAVHESLAWKFLRLPDHELGYPRRQSTRKDSLDQAEMSAYIDQVIAWAESSIPGCRVRRPNEVDLDQVYAPDYDAEAAA